MKSTLIPSKLERPRQRAGFIERPALVARLESSLDGRVTLLSAPAGYGKSTLVAQWLAQPTAPASAWLSLDAMDSDVERFAYYLMSALRRVEPDALQETEAVLSARQLPPPASLAETITSELGGLRRRVVLVLDDYAAIQEEAVHELTRGLVSAASNHLHLVIVTRVDPPLPVSLWDTRHWLHQLRGHDLRFSVDETCAFFEAGIGDRLSTEALSILHARTEGWPAGLRLAQLSLAGAPDPEARVRAFSGSDRRVVDYLIEQVLSSQSEETREFLAVTALVDRFSVGLCDHLFADRRESPDSRRMIRRFNRRNLFLVPLDSRGEWYRYHHLFRQLLLDRVPQLAAVEPADIQGRAGRWFAGKGWVEEGLQYLLAAGDLDGATDLVSEQLHPVMNRQLSRRTVARWIAMFPPGAESTRLPLLVASAYTKIDRWDVEAMQARLDEAERACSLAATEQRLRWQQTHRADLDSLRGYARYWSGDVANALDCTSRAMAASPDPQGYQYALALVYHGAALALAGRTSEYQEFRENGLLRQAAGGGTQIGPYLIVDASVHLYHGALDQCRESATRVISTEDSPAIPQYWRGIGHFLLGVVAYERNQLADAELHFRQVEPQRSDTSPMFYHHTLLGLARVELARGNLEAATDWADRSSRYAREMQSPWLLRNSEWFGLELRLAAGRRAATAQLRPMANDFMRLSLDVPSQSWAWRQLQHGSPEGWGPALDLIDEALSRAREYGVARRTLQLSILRAMALARLGRDTDALDEIEAAVHQAEPQGAIRSFVDRGPVVHELLHRLAARLPGSVYLDQLLAAFDPPGITEPASGASRLAGAESVDGRSPRPDRATGAPPRVETRTALTSREVEILHLLQRRLSNKEIGSLLRVSPETVRKHTVAIYRKLQVHDRRQAVTAAVARRIVKPRDF